MSMQPTHSLREEGYCGICKRNFRDMGRHNLDLHDGRGIHAWRCLSYKGTGHGGRCTYVDCNFTEMKMHYMKHHAEELECIQVKWKKGYYAVEDGHIVPGAPFYPSEHPFSAVDDPDFPARRLEIDEERYQQTERGATPFDPMVRPTSASAMYRMEARRWEDETPPPRKRTRTPSPPRTRRNSREESRRDTDRRSYGGGDDWHQGREPGAAGGYPVECNRLTCGMRLMRTGRERPRQSGTRWPSESRASKKNFCSPCKMWRTSGGKSTVPSKKATKYR